VAIDEVAADMRQGLLALAVGAGLQVMHQLLEADVAAACGPRGRHDPDRSATRHGTERGSVTPGWSAGAGHRAPGPGHRWDRGGVGAGV
jgi:putative transposase